MSIIKPKELQWKLIPGMPISQWIGSIKGHGTSIWFVVKSIPGSDQYSIRNDIDGIPNTGCKGLPKAKSIAQELFNGYVLSLLQTIPVNVR